MTAAVETPRNTVEPIRFDLAAAHAAFDRIENGAGRDGDEALAAQYEGYIGQEYDRYWQAQRDEQDARELADWLATQCGGCEDGGSGDDCDEHVPEDVEMPVWQVAA